MKLSGLVVGGTLAVGAALVPTARAADSPPATDALNAVLQDADERFVAGDLEGARALLEPACSKLERPECEFSLGAVHHGLGHCLEARGHYRRYLLLAPRGEQIDEVTAALEEVEARCGDAPPTPASSEAPGVPRIEPAPSPVDSVPEPVAPPPSAPPPASMTSKLMIGSFALSGAAALGSAAFGVLAVQSARDCERASVYSAEYRRECEEKGPRYQGMWQGLALASASFLGVGVTLWWVDSSSTATIGVSGGGTPVLSYRRHF